MNTQELIDGIINLSYENYKYNPYVERKRVLELVSQLNKPQPIKLKDVIARIKSFDVGTKEVWLNEILNELGSDYGSLKYRTGYKQGRFDCTMEREKVTVPQLVADYIKYAKENDWDLIDAMKGVSYEDYDDLIKWFYKDTNQETFAQAWIFGYTVEEEKRYMVKIKGIDSKSCYLKRVGNKWIISGSDEHRYMYIHTAHTQKELKKAGFGDVFNSPLFEVEEVE